MGGGGTRPKGEPLRRAAVRWAKDGLAPLLAARDMGCLPPVAEEPAALTLAVVAGGAGGGAAEKSPGTPDRGLVERRRSVGAPTLFELTARACRGAAAGPAADPTLPVLAAGRYWRRDAGWGASPDRCRRAGLSER